MIGKAQGGRTAVEFALKGSGWKNVGNVLSEGEQRALALALFLAESSANRGRSAIVLDDPVALLDLERRERVTRRLVEEAKRRQVIVFTHDLAFVQMLQKAAGHAGQETHSQALQRVKGRAGLLSGGGLSGPSAPTAPGPLSDPAGT
ncbi:MAG: AAA family ATPase [Solirubrobacterales bacterium]